MQSKILLQITIALLASAAFSADANSASSSASGGANSSQVTATDGSSASSAISAEALADFSAYMAKHNKKYASMTEMNYRMGLYQKNSDVIRRHNLTASTWKMGVNQFTDMTEDELKAHLVKLTTDQVPLDGSASKAGSKLAGLLNGDRRLQAVTVPAVVPLDSSYSGLSVLRKNSPTISPVRDQKSCGSCYAHASIALVESTLLVKRATKDSNNNLVYAPIDLSEQQIVDCTNEDQPSNGTYYNYGCEGGSIYNSLVYMYRGGITTEANYPYVAIDQNCNATAAGVVSSDTKGLYPNRITQSSMKNMLDNLKIAPVAVAIHVSTALMKYSSGVYDYATDPDINGDFTVNHAILATGFDTTGAPYMEFKNSWGANWGEQGFFRVGFALIDGDNGPLNLLGHSGNSYISH